MIEMRDVNEADCLKNKGRYTDRTSEAAATSKFDVAVAFHQGGGGLFSSEKMRLRYGP